jgi:hypothetical protein
MAFIKVTNKQQRELLQKNLSVKHTSVSMAGEGL